MTTSVRTPPPRPTSVRTPTVFVILAVIATLTIVLPVLALGLRVPWSRFGEILSSAETLEMLRVTLAAAVLSTVLALLLGVPLAVWIQQLRRGSSLVRLLVLLPLAMPPVVAGLALTALIGNRGLAAPLLEPLGIHFAFAFSGVVASHVFVSLPFVIVSADSALRQIDREVLVSAAGVGMQPREILRKITLPTIAPAIATGAGLAFARSLGEFGTTLTFAGSLPGSTRTMSLGIYLERELDQGAAYTLSAILIILAVAVLALASVPAALRREPVPRAREIGELDTAQLRALSAPAEGGLDLKITSAGATSTFPANTITAVVGPNGSGKTTLMGLIAGRLRGAPVTIGGRQVDEPARADFVPAEQRGVVLLTQKPGLPRTSTVRQAITMATRDGRHTMKLLDAAGLGELTDVAVPELSGGQAAQVALVRALATRPRVLILDEPLAAIDVASGARWRRLLRATAPDRTTLMVTHDPLDVAGLSDRIAVLESGRVIAEGDTESLLSVPPTDFVAELAGLNRFSGSVAQVNDGIVEILNGGFALFGTVPDGVSPEDYTVGAAAIATVPPEATTLRLIEPTAAPKESARNVWAGTVSSVQATDTVTTNITVQVGTREMVVPVTRISALSLGLEPGTEVECVTKALSVTVHPHDQ